MADVLLCYAREDAALAGLLAGAVQRQGYRLWSEDRLAGGDVADRVSQAEAAIVIWSPAAAASEWVRAEANFARGQKKLIQVAAGQGPPPLPFRPDDLVSLAGWRGEESHPGWRRVAAALAALCGPAPTAVPRVPAAAATRPARRRGPGPFVALVTLALLAAVALATFLWMQDLAPRSRKAEPPAAAASRRAPAQAPPAAAIAPEPSPAQAAPLPEPAAAETPPPAPAQPRPAGPRIIRENAENMRLFCERAGRGTPECRSFLSQLRGQRR